MISSPTNAETGESSLTFLRLGAGSRPAALAEAVTASGDDITSAYYNPALLSLFNGKNQAAFMYNSYFQDVTQNYLSFATQNSKYVFGGYLVLGKIDEIQRREGPDSLPNGTFEENNFTGAFMVARKFSRFDMGISLKYAYEKIDYATANSYMLDAGIHIPLSEQLNAGAAIKNLGSESKFVSESYPLSIEYRAGLEYLPEFFHGNIAFLGDAVFYSDLDPKVNLGAEYLYGQAFVLRAGYGFGYDSRGLSLGGGVAYRSIDFDYAMVSYKNDLGATHRFTVVLIF